MTEVKKLITEHLDIWLTAKTEKKSGRGRSSGSSNSIYGVQKLRELILDLAISGKLVAQNINDESANELLKRFSKDKKKLISEGKIKKSKQLPNIREDEKLFELPNGWIFTRWENITYKIGDIDHKMPKSELSGYPFVSPRDFYGQMIDFENAKKISSEDFEYLSKKIFPEKGDLIYPRYGTIGENVLVDTDEKFVVSYSCAIIKTAKKYINPRYQFFYSISTFCRLQAVAATNITTQPNVGIKSIQEYIIPLPPLEEQQRIVAKVDELMQLCDQLEQHQNLSSEAHDQLVDTLLNVLMNSSDVEEFQQNWRRISENFDLLFTTEYSIDQLKQTILQLAVMGKLVKQDPNDEPASELLKQIAEEKAKLIKEGKIKKSKTLPEISDEEKPFDLPSGWIYTKIADLCRPISSGSTPSADKFTQSGIPFLKVYNIRDQKIDFSYKEQFIDDEIHKGKLSRSRLYPNDVVMNIVGPPLGKIAIIPDDYPEWNCNQAIVFFGVLVPDISEYLYTYLCEGSFLNQIELIGTAGQDNISVTKSQNIVIPLPPLNEQRRIVKKVNQLFSIIGHFQVLQSKLRKTKLHLADSLVSNALNDSNDKSKSETTDNVIQFEKPIETIKQSK